MCFGCLEMCSFEVFGYLDAVVSRVVCEVFGVSTCCLGLFSATVVICVCDEWRAWLFDGCEEAVAIGFFLYVGDWGVPFENFCFDGPA